MYNFWDNYKEVIAICIIIIVLVIGGTVGLAYGLARPMCNAQTADIGLPHRWSFLGRCQVQENDTWIPLDNWRYFGEQP